MQQLLQHEYYVQNPGVALRPPPPPASVAASQYIQLLIRENERGAFGSRASLGPPSSLRSPFACSLTGHAATHDANVHAASLRPHLSQLRGPSRCREAQPGRTRPHPTKVQTMPFVPRARLSPARMTTVGSSAIIRSFLPAPRLHPAMLVACSGVRSTF